MKAILTDVNIIMTCYLPYILSDAVAVHKGISFRHVKVTGQDLENGGLASPIDSQEAKALPRRDPKVEVVHCFHPSWVGFTQIPEGGMMCWQGSWYQIFASFNI